MTQEFAISPLAEPVWRRPWPMLLAGLGLAGLGLVLGEVFAGQLSPLRLFLLGGGVIVAGLAVQRRLTIADETLDQRLESAGLVAAAGGVALVAFLGMDKSWDSGRLVLGAACLVAISGSVVVACTGFLRRFLLILFALYHLGGVATAITMLPPPGREGPAPFLPVQAWNYLYRPYLQFLFQTNAYHFYSPEPGPPTHLWFYLRYDNGQTKWFKMPNREDSPVYLHYQRLLSVTEFTNQNATGYIPRHILERIHGKEKIDKIKDPNEYQFLQNQAMSDFMTKREKAASLPLFKHGGIPPHPFVTAQALQFQPPDDYSDKMIGGVIRRIGREFAHLPEEPGANLISIKMYRIRHWIISQSEFAKGGDPNDPTLFMAYFMGEFKPDGTLLNKEDPFLYWLIPIYKTPDGQLWDYVDEHATTDYNAALRDLNEEKK